jgi:hypothetical protein
MGNLLLPFSYFFFRCPPFLSFFGVCRTARMGGSFADISVPAHVFHGFTFAEGHRWRNQPNCIARIAAQG